MIASSNEIVNVLTPIISQQISVSQIIKIETSQMEVTHFKQIVSLMPKQFNLNDSFIQTSLCDLINGSSSNSSCSNRIVTQRSIIMQTALTGLNGDNETNIGLSKSIEFSLYDEKHKEIPVSNQMKPLDIWISRNQKDNSLFHLVNVTSNGSDSLAGGQYINGFYVNGFTLSGSNQSIQIQLKPNKMNKTYLVLVKFGDNPSLKSNYYDLKNILCPQDLHTAENVYLTFVNMSSVNGRKGYVGYSITELNVNCENKSLNINETMNGTLVDNFEIRVYTSGCYFMDTRESNYALG
jgi:hypothetical protein